MKELKMLCLVCEKEVDWDNVVRQFPSILDRVDMYGEMSLNEYEQSVYNGKICSLSCYLEHINW